MHAQRINVSNRLIVKMDPLNAGMNRSKSVARPNVPSTHGLKILIPGQCLCC